MHSDNINEIAAALSKVQGELKPVDKRKEVGKGTKFTYHYAELADCIEVTKSILAKNNLAIVQTTDTDYNDDSNSYETFLETVLVHSSGQWFKSSYLLQPTKEDPQGYGSALTYARRYCYMAIIGLSAWDDDDDGRAASNIEELIKPIDILQKTFKKPPLLIKSDWIMSDSQRKRLFAININNANLDDDKLHDLYELLWDVRTSKELSKECYEYLCDCLLPNYHDRETQAYLKELEKKKLQDLGQLALKEIQGDQTNG
jgi:hypothetical protein